MYKIERIGDLKRIVKLFGNISQLLKFSEESGELIQACVRFEDGKVTDIECIEEEIADVYVMLDQIRLMYPTDDRRIKEIYNQKIDRVSFKYF